MAQLDNLKRLMVKRQMLRTAVAHDVAVVQGRRLPRERQARRRGLLVMAAVALTIVAAVAGVAMWRSTTNAPPALIASAGAAPLDRASTAVSSPSISDPRPVDSGLFPLSLHTVVIDAGHGGDNEGAHARFGVSEKTLTLDIARRLRGVLAARRYSVVMTRDEDVPLTLRRRAEIANEASGDVFVSIHLNWIDGPQTGGIETYYLGRAEDAALERRVAEENRDSGYRIANLRQLLDQLYTNARRDESAQLAGTVQQALLAGLRGMKPRMPDRGIKTAPFVVLMTTAMPAILAEVSSLSNPEEVALLKSDAYRDRIANALADGIEGYTRVRERGRAARPPAS